MEAKILNELQQLKQLTLLGAKNVLTMSDVALLTGLSKSHLYKCVHRKTIPYYKGTGGKLTFFDKKDVEAFMLKHRVKSVDEIQQEATTYVVTGKKRKEASV